VSTCTYARDRSYTDRMTGHVKGTTPDSAIAKIREAFALATATIYAWPDASEAWKAANELGGLVRELRHESAEFRGYLAAYLADYHKLTTRELAPWLGVSQQRASQLIALAREKGNPVTEPTTLPEQPHVALAIITSDRGVLIARRVDGIPPWTFLGGEIQIGESAADALRRRVQAEGNLTMTSVRFIGRRIHPKTSRVMVYAHVEVEPGEPELGDPEDLAEVRWVTIDETRELMPDMYGPVRQYLDDLQRAPA
jgi:ADP-ribose pyrophosphatase YjhB (NUDIX family)